MKKKNHAISPFAGISLVNSLVYQKYSLRSIIAQITFKQMSEGPLFVWLKLSENTTHFKTFSTDSLKTSPAPFVSHF